jgi:hypothetical protein
MNAKVKSKHVSQETIVAPLTPCPACGSDDRSDLFGRITHQGSCRVNGREAKGVTISRTKCLKCGQCYLVREPVQEPIAT